MPNFKFYGNVNQRQRIFLSLSKLECGPQEINSREICPQLALSANQSEHDKVGKNAHSILKRRSRCRRRCRCQGSPIALRWEDLLLQLPFKRTSYPRLAEFFFLSFLIPDSSRPSHQTVRTGYFILDISRTDHWPRQRKSWYIPTKETTSRGSGSPGPGPFLPFSTPRSLVARLVGVGSFSRKVANYRAYLVLGCRYVYVKIIPIRHKQ